ncbi:Eco57I restriction-modification methylase domain-containing protein [Sphingomonas aracearum]|uniref:site-specific DNA-methyltransferase (adenine-specific) n=1 Tax=Sphingomonas aracearum TaxID=2283317 RepID=A0A369VV47_9SPHN|nr:N-6 DNA methylase [Sphingomonas aracearum]RDE05963.1 type II DNA modification enzyme [Sphingomonas aracearum]
MTRRTAELGLEAITIEGGLIAPEQIAAIAASDRNPRAAADYDVPKGLTLGDEIARFFRIGQAIWRDYARIDAPTVTQTAAFARDLLAGAFGFDDLTGPIDHNAGTRRFRIAWQARNGRIPVVVAAPARDDKGRDIGFTRALPEFGDGAEGRARRAPIILLQDWLNHSDAALWGLVFAGDRVRLMRDNASLTRAAWLEADLAAMFREEMFADFTAWWLLTHASRFGKPSTPPSSAPLEQAREAGLKQGTAARERLREGVQTALEELGRGLVEANPSVRDTLAHDPAAATALFEELLRSVYRLIFLAVAEERNLLHPRTTPQRARDLYAESYSFGFWRTRSTRRVAYDAHHDAWEGMKITLAALEQGQSLLGLPALGGMFARASTPTLDGARIPNRRFLAAIHALGFITVNSTRTRINWRDMRTEELGSVYESLLEIRAYLAPDGAFALDSGAKGNARKTSGSYYTPDSLVETLLDSALDPVLDRAEVNGGVDAILDLKVIDPACGSGHFLLGAARRMAERVATLRDPDAPDRQAALRDVVGRCIHGVDRNPMAVELAKVALWIESVSPGQPLGFLDANIRCGDALLGVFDLAALEEGVPDEAYKPLTGDDKAAAKYYLQQNRAAKKGQGQFDWSGGTGAMPPRRLAANLATIRRMPEDTVGQVEKKRAAFEAWRHDPARYATRVACDLYVAAFLLPKTEVPLNHGRNMVPTTAEVRNRLGGGQVYGPLEAAAVDAAGTARVFHWPLAFPDVMVERGGFDVVLGNPPWEVVQLGEEEYFESRAPEIAEMKGAARKKAIAALEAERPELHAEYARDKRMFEAVNEFARASGRFDLTARGKVNTYALFAEHFLSLTGEQGRAGVIVPTGIATDATTAPFFGHLVSAERLSSLFSAYEVRQWFKGTDDRKSFCLLTFGHCSRPEFTFDFRQISDLDDQRRRFTLTPQEIARINPNTKTAPVFRTGQDAQLTAAIYDRVPVLVEEAKGLTGDPWSIEFRQGLFNMTSDSGLFRTATQLARNGWVRDGADWVRGDEGETLGLTPQADRAAAVDHRPVTDRRYVPLYEAKMIHQFDHRWATYVGQDGTEASRDVTLAEKQDPTFEPTPRYWILEREIMERLQAKGWARGWLMGWRDISLTSVERTVISACLPAMGINHKTPLFFVDASLRHCVALYANLDALVHDYCARQKLSGSSLTYFYLKQFPILPPTAYTEADLAFIVPRVLELTYTSHSMAPFARDLGCDDPPFAWGEDRRAQLRAELDAWYVLAYGLSRDELRYVLDPKDVMGADYPSETFRVLQKNEIAKYGEYRTRRLVLAAYDALTAAAPDTSEVADGRWQGSISDDREVRLLLAAIVKRMRQPRPLREVVGAFLYASQPHLLVPRLNATAQSEWRRLIGGAADLPVTQNVVTISSSQVSHFGTAQAWLLGRDAMRFDVQTGLLDRGAAIYSIEVPAMYQDRADFVWHAMRSIDLDAAMPALPSLVSTFVAQAAAA